MGLWFDLWPACIMNHLNHSEVYFSHLFRIQTRCVCVWCVVLIGVHAACCLEVVREIGPMHERVYSFIIRTYP